MVPTVPVIACTAKMQEPNCVVPVAVPVDVAIENAGVVDVLVKVIVVGVVVPNAETPLGNANGTLATAGAVVEFVANVVSAAATSVGADPPPPHDATTTAMSKLNARPIAFFMGILFGAIQEVRTVQQGVSSVKKFGAICDTLARIRVAADGQISPRSPPPLNLPGMPSIHHLSAAALLTIACAAAEGQVSSTLTQAGYTGLEITPSAHLIDWGRTDLTYDNQLPGVVANPSGRNYVLGFGILPNLEFSARLATNTLHTNCITANCGIRDLSGSGKLGIGLDAGHHWSAAFGATDVGGAATNFRTYYGVLTLDRGPFQASAGVARRRVASATGPRSPLSGAFAAAAWQPLPWIRGQIEYADRNAWAGVRLFAPPSWLPAGWSAYIGSNHRLNSSNLSRPAWITAGLSIPLYKVPSLPAGERGPDFRNASAAEPPSIGTAVRDLNGAPASISSAPAGSVPGTSVPTALRPSIAEPSKPAPPTDADLQALGSQLEAEGLEDIWVGRLADGSVAVRGDNAVYNWNSADALGAALGAVARTLGGTKAPYRLVLTQRQVPLVAVTGQSDCLRQWIRDANAPCAAGELSTPGGGALEPLLAGADWVVVRRRASSRTLHVSISPVLRNAIGTEFGALDYSAGVNVGLRLPLWSGASAEWRRDFPVASSASYEPNQPFDPWRVRSLTERFALTQTVRVPLEHWLGRGDDAKAMRWGLTAVTAQATVGRVGNAMDGADGQLRWEPGEGRHRLAADVGYFRNALHNTIDSRFGPRYARPLLASYRYNFVPTRTYVEATGGQFLYNDRGIQFGVRQWFADVAVSAYYRRTRSQGAPVRQFIGFEVSIPIGPRRDVAVGRHVTVGGTPRFRQGNETVVRSPVNFYLPGYGLTTPAPSLDEEFNSDRSGLDYFQDNIPRIRDAAK
jgi:hypothetical protein